MKLTVTTPCFALTGLLAAAQLALLSGSFLSGSFLSAPSLSDSFLLRPDAFAAAVKLLRAFAAFCFLEAWLARLARCWATTSGSAG